MSYSDVVADDKRSALYFQVKYDAALCGDFSKKSEEFIRQGVYWCVDNFKKLLDTRESFHALLFLFQPDATV